MNTTRGLSVLFFYGVLSGGVHAAGDIDMTFRGRLIEPPPCTINNGNRVDVDFGDRVGVNRVDGNEYRREVNYQIVCDRGGSWTMTLSLNGTTAGFDADALLSNKTDLGIRVYQDGKPFRPGSVLTIDPNKPPTLEAVPVKRPGSTLTEGAFEAWATLQAEYQ